MELWWLCGAGGRITFSPGRTLFIDGRGFGDIINNNSNIVLGGEKKWRSG
jgi:hypothetical protein